MGESGELRILVVIHCLRKDWHIHSNHLGQKSRNQGAETLLAEKIMRTEYDFTKAQPNPYAKRLKKAVTIRLETDIIDYFKSLTAETGIPYQNLINLYLLDCAKSGRKLSLTWKK